MALPVMWAEVARCLQKLITGWIVRGTYPGGGENFSINSARHWDPPSLLYSGYWITLGGKAAGAWSWPPTLI